MVFSRCYSYKVATSIKSPVVEHSYVSIPFLVSVLPFRRQRFSTGVFYVYLSENLTKYVDPKSTYGRSKINEVPVLVTWSERMKLSIYSILFGVARGHRRQGTGLFPRIVWLVAVVFNFVRVFVR